MTPQSIVKIWNKAKNKKDFEQKLTDRGFSYFGCGDNSVVYSKKDINFVIKVGKGVCTRKLPKELERFRLPYIYTNGNRQIAIQLKVDTSKTYEARKIIDSSCSRTNLLDYDIHQDNVGWLDGKPVIFDYL